MQCNDYICFDKRGIEYCAGIEFCCDEPFICDELFHLANHFNPVRINAYFDERESY